MHEARTPWQLPAASVPSEGTQGDKCHLRPSSEGSPATHFQEDKSHVHKPTVSPPAGGFGDRAVTHVLLQGGTQSTQSSLSSHRSQQLRPAEPHKSATEPNLHLRRQTQPPGNCP